jgi:TetR/AcrR family transcriptional regulator, transcriptional repressor for nem operon
VRERIVQAASRHFRGRGSGDVAIADLMSDLQLTHGGFYRHFKGKEHLFNDAFLAAAAETRARMQAVAGQAPPGRELEAIVNTYLSPGHCANPGSGCPIAALATDISRHPKSTRATFDRAIGQHAAALARFMPGETAAEREQNAIVLFAGMAGTLALARATASDALRMGILEAARKFYVRLAHRGD